MGPAASDEAFVSLYRRFRPGRFAELVGQPHVVAGLQHAVRDGRVAHAYLFSGPRGTGKTSAARILARALNCRSPEDGEPCGICDSCVEIARGSSLDVHELDAASNNGVDAMRDLVAHAALATPGRWKVYIVDEVHMLSNAAANALLKTLEEPPSHVVFVLATTDPQKVPATIRSRTQHYEFRLFGFDTLVSLLRTVRDRAGLDLDDDVLALAARRGHGSARDALSALDQLAASGSSTDERPGLAAILDALGDEDAQALLVAASALHEAGWAPQQLAVEIVDDLRQAFLLAVAPELAAVDGPERQRLEAQGTRLGLPRLVRAMELLGRAQVDMREAPDARVVLEVTLVRVARADLDESTSALAERVARLEQAMAAAPPSAGPPAAPRASAPRSPGARPTLGALRKERQAASGEPEPTAPPAAPPIAAAPAAAGEPPDRDGLVQAWGDQILRSLPPLAKALYSAGRFVSVDDGTAVFAVANPPHRDRCADLQPAVEDALAAHFGVPVAIRLVLETESDPSSTAVAGRTGRDPGGKTEPADVADLGDDEFDPDDPGVPLEIDTLVQARLLEAFPGAEEVRP
ncbi:MAG TPA: DNA polymerase III subunit gamma/tau [Acidimicrobiales bacterium]|nr:DNA polymerase III subunit gamma/tau [Acidimicrobiales bacterium]